MSTVNNSYENHVSILKDLKMADSFYEAREPYKEAFEEIYNKAKDENVTMSSAKDFLNSLSKDDLSTLQNYTLLVDEINVNSLNDEGAYNLLLHHYEKYDFNNDGFVSNGIGKNSELIPKNMPDLEKEAFVKTLNEMDEKDRFMTLAFAFPLKIEIEGVTSSSNTNDTFYDLQEIMARIDRILNPLPGEVRSSELLATFELFKEMFSKNYDELSDQKEKINSDINNSAYLTKAKMSTEV